MPTEREIEAAYEAMRECAFNARTKISRALEAAERVRYQCPECRGEMRMGHHEDAERDRCVVCGGCGFDPETTEWVCEMGIMCSPDDQRHALPPFEHCGWYPKRRRLGP